MKPWLSRFWRMSAPQRLMATEGAAALLRSLRVRRRRAMLRAHAAECERLQRLFPGRVYAGGYVKVGYRKAIWARAIWIDWRGGHARIVASSPSEIPDKKIS